MTDVEISSTARSDRRKLRTRGFVVAGSVVTVLGTVLLPAARPVSADPLSSARAQAAQANSVLQADASKLDALAQQYEAAQGQLQQIEAQLAQTKATIASDQAQVGADQGALRTAALAAYMTDTSTSGLESIFGPGGEQAAATDEYSNLASGDLSTAVDTLTQDQTRLSALESQQAAEQARAQATVDQIAAARSAAQATEAAQQATLRSLNGQVASLVAQQQAAASAATLNRIGAGWANLPPSAGGQRAVQAAESQIGVPYEWGGESPGQGFDCSGLTQWSWRQAGVGLPRTADEQMHAVARIPMSDMEPGDLVFWGSGGSASHVAIYVGNGDVVDAPSQGQRVQIQPIWSSGLMGAGRP